jgi:hypothetical protein
LRKKVLLRWGAGAVGAGRVCGGAFNGALLGVLRLDEGRVPSRNYAGRGMVPVAIPGRWAVGLAGGWLGVGGLGVGGLGIGG